VNHRSSTRRACLPAIFVLGVLALSGAAVAEQQDTSAWRFRVLLDDKPIGHHTFELAETGDGYRLTTEAAFDVRILFINAFRYRHRNVETWSGDCLESIDAQTDSNGREFSVTGRRGRDGFSLSANDDDGLLPGCIRTFAYWQPSILGEDRLLNSQTGEYEAVESHFDGRDEIVANGEAIAAERYVLETRAGDVTLWYGADDGRWLALEAPARGGRKLRYEPELLPSADGPVRLAGRAFDGRSGAGG